MEEVNSPLAETSYMINEDDVNDILDDLDFLDEVPEGSPTSSLPVSNANACDENVKSLVGTEEEQASSAAAPFCVLSEHSQSSIPFLEDCAPKEILPSVPSKDDISVLARTIMEHLNKFKTQPAILEILENKESGECSDASGADEQTETIKEKKRHLKRHEAKRKKEMMTTTLNVNVTAPGETSRVVNYDSGVVDTRPKYLRTYDLRNKLLRHTKRENLRIRVQSSSSSCSPIKSKILKPRTILQNETKLKSKAVTSKKPRTTKSKQTLELSGVDSNHSSQDDSVNTGKKSKKLKIKVKENKIKKHAQHKEKKKRKISNVPVENVARIQDISQTESPYEEFDIAALDDRPTDVLTACNNEVFDIVSRKSPLLKPMADSTADSPVSVSSAKTIRRHNSGEDFDRDMQINEQQRLVVTRQHPGQKETALPVVADSSTSPREKATHSTVERLSKQSSSHKRRRSTVTLGNTSPDADLDDELDLFRLKTNLQNQLASSSHSSSSSTWRKENARASKSPSGDRLSSITLSSLHRTSSDLSLVSSISSRHSDSNSDCVSKSQAAKRKHSSGKSSPSRDDVPRSNSRTCKSRSDLNKSRSRFRKSESYSKVRNSRSHSRTRYSRSNRSHSETRNPQSHSRTRKSRSHSKTRKSRSHSKTRNSRSHSTRNSRSHSKTRTPESQSRIKKSRSHSRTRKSRSHSKTRNSRSHSKTRDPESQSRIEKSRSHSRTRKSRSYSESRNSRSHSRSHSRTNNSSPSKGYKTQQSSKQRTRDSRSNSINKSSISNTKVRSSKIRGHHSGNQKSCSRSRSRSITKRARGERLRKSRSRSKHRRSRSPPYSRRSYLRRSRSISSDRHIRSSRYSRSNHDKRVLPGRPRNRNYDLTPERRAYRSRSRSSGYDRRRLLSKRKAGRSLTPSRKVNANICNPAAVPTEPMATVLNSSQTQTIIQTVPVAVSQPSTQFPTDNYYPPPPVAGSIPYYQLGPPNPSYPRIMGSSYAQAAYTMTSVQVCQPPGYIAAQNIFSHPPPMIMQTQPANYGPPIQNFAYSLPPRMPVYNTNLRSIGKTLPIRPARQVSPLISRLKHVLGSQLDGTAVENTGGPTGGSTSTDAATSLTDDIHIIKNASTSSPKISINLLSGKTNIPKKKEVSAVSQNSSPLVLPTHSPNPYNNRHLIEIPRKPATVACHVIDLVDDVSPQPRSEKCIELLKKSDPDTPSSNKTGLTNSVALDLLQKKLICTHRSVSTQVDAFKGNLNGSVGDFNFDNEVHKGSVELFNYISKIFNDLK